MKRVLTIMALLTVFVGGVPTLSAQADLDDFELAVIPTSRATAEQCVAETLNQLRIDSQLPPLHVDNSFQRWLREKTYDNAGLTLSQAWGASIDASELLEHLPPGDDQTWNVITQGSWYFSLVSWESACRTAVTIIRENNRPVLTSSEYLYLTVAAASRTGSGDNPNDSESWTHVRNFTVVGWAVSCYGEAANDPGCSGTEEPGPSDPDSPVAPGSTPFEDISGHTFESAIERLAQAGITKGCNPAQGNTRFCPGDYVTRGQMAAFLTRALSLPAYNGPDRFTDDNGNTFESAIERLAQAGITKGCNPAQGNTRFCPGDYVTRGQMAAFLVRAGLAD